jgi:hypothetical protein
VKKKVGEENARHMINMMRSLASNLPISPFHLAAADDMESLLNEVLLHRKKKEWIGLTDEEIEQAAQGGDTNFWDFCRIIEAKLKEKNGN